MREQQLEENIVINLNEGNFKDNIEETQQSPNLTQESMKTHNLLSLLRLPIRHAKGK
jgi:hypothetical protein